MTTEYPGEGAASCLPVTFEPDEHLTLSALRTDKFKAGQLSLTLTLPIVREQVYLTSLLLSVLLRGTERYPTVTAINRRLDYLYGTELSVRSFYRGDCLVVGLAADLLDAAYLPPGTESVMDGVLEVMRQIFFHPFTDGNGLLDGGYVESEKALQCDAIRAKKNHPASYAAGRCRALMYEGEPCGAPIYGEVEEVMAVTPEQLTAHWHALRQTMHWNAFYVGPEAPEAVADALRRMMLPELSGLPGARPVSPLSPNPIRTAGAVKRAEEQLPVGQGQLVMGFRTGVRLDDPEFYATMVFHEIFGASPVSRLFMNVREKLSLCYSCSSTYNIYKGTVLVAAGLDNENRHAAEAEILLQLAELGAGRFSEEELEAAKKSLDNAFCQLEDSRNAMDSFYTGRMSVGVTDTPAHCRERFRAVRREEVMAAAMRMTPDTVFFLEQTGERREEDDDGEED